MASIRKRANRWQVQIRRKGQPPLTKTFRLKTSAEAWARQMETQIEQKVSLGGNSAVQAVEHFRQELLDRIEAGGSLAGSFVHIQRPVHLDHVCQILANGRENHDNST